MVRVGFAILLVVVLLTANILVGCGPAVVPDGSTGDTIENVDSTPPPVDGDDLVIDVDDPDPTDDAIDPSGDNAAEGEDLLDTYYGLVPIPSFQDANGNDVTFVKVSADELWEKYEAVVGMIMRNPDDATYTILLSEKLAYTPEPFQIYAIDMLADIAREDGYRPEVRFGSEEYTNDPWEVMDRLEYGDEEREIVNRYRQFFFGNNDPLTPPTNINNGPAGG